VQTLSLFIFAKNYKKKTQQNHPISTYGIGCIHYNNACLTASFSRTTWVSQHQKRKTILDFNEARDDRVAVASAGPYANHLLLVPDRQACQHLITQFYKLNALPDQADAQPTVTKH